MERIHLTSGDLPHGWVLHYFASCDAALTRSSLAAAFVVGLAALEFIALQMQRGRRVGAALARSEPEAFDDIDLRDAMRTALALVEPNRQAAGAEIEVDLPEDPVVIRRIQPVAN